MSDRVIILGNAKAALAAAVEAAESAAIAAGIATGLNYEGLIDGADVAALTPDQGDLYLVNVTGGAYTEGDWIAYNGATWDVLPDSLFNPTATTSIPGWVELATQAEVDAANAAKVVTGATLQGYVNPQLADRSRKGRVISDGVTSNRRIQLTPGDVGNIAGLPGVYLIDVPAIAAVPTADVYLAARAASGAAAPVGQNHSFSAYVAQTSGDLVITARGATAATDHITLTVAGYVGTYGAYARRLSLNATEGNSATGMEVVLDGVTLSPTPTSGGTAVWQSDSLVATVALDGYNWPAADMPRVLYGVGEMSTAEVAAWHRDGTIPARMEQAGSAVLVGPVNGDFTGYTGTADDATPDTFTNWTIGSNLAAYAITGGLRVLVGASFANNASAANNIRQTPPLTNGIGYLTAIRARALGDTTLMAVYSQRENTIGAAALTGSMATYWTVATATNTGTADLAFRPLDGTLGGGGGIEVEYIRIYQAGLLDKPVVQPANCTADGMLESRFTRTIFGGRSAPGDDHGGMVEIALPYAYTGSSIQLGGGVMLADIPYRIDSFTLTADAPVNASLGTSSGGTQLVNAQAVVSGNNSIETFASRIVAASSSLYLTFSGTCSGNLKLRLSRI